MHPFLPFRLSRLQLPALFLIALLQRTPVLRLLVGSLPPSLSTSAHILRAAVGAAALGAVDTLAGATTFVMNPSGTPVNGTVGTQLSLAFTYTGTPSIPQYFSVSGTLPPGLSFTPALTNGVVLSGSPVISGTPTQAGSYRIQVRGYGTGGNGPLVPIDFAITGGTTGGLTARISNLSVRTNMAAGQRLTMGVVVGGGGSRNILMRAAGPALTGYGVQGAMADPSLELFVNGSPTLQNNDWASTLASTFAGVGAFAFPAGSKDAAFVQPMDGARTVDAYGTGPGTVLVEAYDTGTGNSPRLINASARNRVGTGNDILIAGFALSGTGKKRLLIRAVGPTLTRFGVSGILNDPLLTIYDAAGRSLATNDTWTSTLSTTFASVGAFALDAGSKDAALLLDLDLGATTTTVTYTAHVRGADGGTGEALVEIYEVP